MRKAITTLLGGILIGVVAMYAADRYESRERQRADEVVRDIGKGPKWPADIAEQLRDEQYTNLHSIEDINALPTEFDRAEALGDEHASRVNARRHHPAYVVAADRIQRRPGCIDLGNRG